MGMFEWAKAQFIEIIEWVDDSRDTLVWRFPVYRKEIKNGAQLVVREGQAALLVNEGYLADVYIPGRHELSTRNMPVLSSFKGWKYGFESPFKAEVYFVSTRLFADRRWGTPNPIMLRDADFGVLRLRAFGTYALRVRDAASFLRQHLGTTGQLDADAISGHLRNLIVSRFADQLGESKVAALDLAAKYDELAIALQKRLNEEFHEQGLELVNLAIENISLPPEVEKALDTRSKMAVMGDPARYQAFQTAEATTIAAANPGMGGAGMGMGVGMALGQQMAGQLAAQRPGPSADAFAAPAAGPALAAPASSSGELETRLKKLQALQQASLITPEEAQAQRARLLESLL